MNFDHTIFENTQPHSFPLADYYGQTYGKPANVTTVFGIKAETDVLELLKKTGESIDTINRRSVIEVTYDSIDCVYKISLPNNNVYVKCFHEKNTRNLSNLSKDFPDNPDTKKVDIYHSLDTQTTGFVSSFVDTLRLHQAIPDPTGKCYLIIKDAYGGLNLTEFKVKADEVDMELNYGAEFAHKIDCLVAKVNSEKMNGVSLLHGLPGTGKTSAVRLLTKRFHNRKVIFVPPFLTDAITSPEFLPFLLENPGSVLVLEDAEKVLMSRDHNPAGGQGVSSILNLTDGLLADALNMHIIATFNADRTTIDKALLREGRLCVEHKFDKLSVDQSNRLLAHLNPTANNTTTKPLTLAEIYTFGEEKLTSQQQSQSIGFTR